MSTATTDQRVDFHGVDWDRYLAIADALPDQAGRRMIYVDGDLQIVTTSRRHEWHVAVLSRIIESLACKARLAISPAGSSTYRDGDKAVAVEGDAAFYLGQHAVEMRGPVDVDLSVQPPPDLVVEVERTNPVDQAVIAWDRLGAPEVWRLNIARIRLEFLSRREAGGYDKVDRSRHFPRIAPTDVLEEIRRAEAVEYNRWRHGLDDWAEAKLGPR